MRVSVDVLWLHDYVIMHAHHGVRHVISIVNHGAFVAQRSK